MDELLQEFLSSPPAQRPKQCRTCANPRAAQLVRELAALKSEGKVHHTWDSVRKYLEAKLGFKVSASGLRRHVQECL